MTKATDRTCSTLLQNIIGKRDISNIITETFRVDNLGSGSTDSTAHHEEELLTSSPTVALFLVDFLPSSLVRRYSLQDHRRAINPEASECVVSFWWGR